MLYKRVLNKGNGKVLDRMVVNESFPALWRNLMNEVAEWIERAEKLEEGRSATSSVSRGPIYQAIRELQYKPDRILDRHGAQAGTRDLLSAHGGAGYAR